MRKQGAIHARCRQRDAQKSSQNTRCDEKYKRKCKGHYPPPHTYGARANGSETGNPHADGGSEGYGKKRGATKNPDTGVAGHVRHHQSEGDDGDKQQHFNQKGRSSSSR